MMPYVLLRFLIKEKALSAYVDNIMSNKYDGKLTVIEHYMNGLERSRLIIAAFIWHKAPQGGEYWSQLDQKWCRYLYIGRYE